MQMFKAYDFITKDLSRAFSLTKFWKKLLKNQIIFTVDDTDFGYSLEENKIIRIVGKFDTKQNKWIKKTKNVIMSDVINLSFTPLYKKKGSIKAINLDIKCVNGIDIKCIIAMRLDNL